MHEVYPVNEEAYEEWREWRHKEKRIKIGPTGEKKQRQLLCKYPPPVQQAIIDKAICGGYQGLFPLTRIEHEAAFGITGGHPDSRRLSGADRTRLLREQGSNHIERSSSMGRMDSDQERMANWNGELVRRPAISLGLRSGWVYKGTGWCGHQESEKACERLPTQRPDIQEALFDAGPGEEGA